MKAITVLIILLLIISPIYFIHGLILIISSNDRKKNSQGVKILIISTLVFIIGFGGCQMLM